MIKKKPEKKVREITIGLTVKAFNTIKDYLKKQKVKSGDSLNIDWPEHRLRFEIDDESKEPKAKKAIS